MMLLHSEQENRTAKRSCYGLVLKHESGKSLTVKCCPRLLSVKRDRFSIQRPTCRLRLLHAMNSAFESFSSWFESCESEQNHVRILVRN